MRIKRSCRFVEMPILSIMVFVFACLMKCAGDEIDTNATYKVYVDIVNPEAPIWMMDKGENNSYEHNPPHYIYNDILRKDKIIEKTYDASLKTLSEVNADPESLLENTVNEDVGVNIVIELLYAKNDYLYLAVDIGQRYLAGFNGWSINNRPYITPRLRTRSLKSSALAVKLNQWNTFPGTDEGYYIKIWIGSGSEIPTMESEGPQKMFIAPY